MTRERSRAIHWAAMAIMAAFGVLPSGHAMGQSSQGFGGLSDFARGRILVMARSGLSAAELDKIVKVHGGKARRIGQSNLHIVDLPASASERAVVEQLARNPHLKFAELDYRSKIAFVTNDPYLGSEWHISSIGVPSAWDTTLGSGVTVAILDTGVDATHPDLAASMVQGWNFADGNADSSDVHGHGTKAAGVVAASANNGFGVAGIAGQSKIMPIRVTAPDGSFFYSAVAQGLTYAADHGARVANMSIYGALNSSAIRSAAQYMKDKGGLVITSAGNNGIDEGWPATSSMIVVSATDSTDVKTSWSSYGDFVSMSAPGVGIWTTTMGGGYAAVSGTSFSSPITAGVVALMMAANPKLGSADVEKLLFSSAVDLGLPGRDSYYGYGRVNAAAAVRAAAGASSTIDQQSPSASISAPLSGSTVSGLVAVNVDATDNVGVSKVELRVNGSTVAVDTSQPFAFTWDSTGVPNGTANIVAYSFDAAGNSAASAVAVVNVANAVLSAVTDTSPPLVDVINPTDGAKVAGVFSISVMASDNTGSSQLTQALLIDGIQVAATTGGTLSYKWNTKKIASGAHTVQAVVRDAAGNQSSRVVQVYK